MSWSFLLPLLLVVILIACVGTLYTEGMWGNAVRLINVVTAALLATNFWEPTARLLERMIGASFTYWWDFIALWALFALFVTIFRLLTDRVSRVKVRFFSLANRIGSVFLAVCVGWVMVCFTTFTLHTAPLKEKFFFGGFNADPEVRMFFGLAPDRQWWKFTHSVSKGAFCRSASDEDVQQGTYPAPPNASEAAGKLCVFDGNAGFVAKYTDRRAGLEKHVNSKKSVRVSEGQAPPR